MWEVPVAVAAAVSAVVIATGFAPTAFGAPAIHPVQAPSPGPTAAPDPHASMSGMDPHMPGMESSQSAMDPDMPGMDHDMPGMSHDELDGMSDEEMPGMDHGASTHEVGHPGGTSPESARPQAAVVGTFVMVNGGVLLTAGLMRRRAKASANRPSRASRPAK